MSAEFALRPEDRVLLIINDRVIQGSTRFQKYGFLLSKQYGKKLASLKTDYGLDFYDDWRPHYFGPYSQKLQQDIETCIKSGLVNKILVDKTNQYALTLRGRVRWRKLNRLAPDEMAKITEKIAVLQKTSLYHLLKLIYDAYPKYAVNSTIKEKLDQT